MNELSRLRRKPLWAACAAVRITIRKTHLPMHSSVWMEGVERRFLLSSPLTAVPILHSDPKASAKLYLDFDGDPVTPDWLGVTVPVTPAYDIDGDPTTFSSTELKNIQEIWARVAEKYSPFNIDVTTVDPGNLDNLKTTRIVIGGDGGWLGADAGGVAPIGGFSNDSPNTGYVFSGLDGESTKVIGEQAAHEAGHTFGLLHHSIFNADGTVATEYDPGDALTAPIMGVIL